MLMKLQTILRHFLRYYDLDENAAAQALHEAPHTIGRILRGVIELKQGETLRMLENMKMYDRRERDPEKIPIYQSSDSELEEGEMRVVIETPHTVLDIEGTKEEIEGEIKKFFL